MDSSSTIKMPDGQDFLFWEDRTRYSRTYHVAGAHPEASDRSPGTEDRPFATIGRAAELLRPGEKVVIHGGTYREMVRPACGGEGAERMIAYEAAAGEKVVIKGSRLWQPEWRPSEGWNVRAAGGTSIWMGDLPAAWFGGYNPFAANNIFPHLCEFIAEWPRRELERFQMHRGTIFADGAPLAEVLHPRQLAERDGVFWVEEPGMRLHFRLSGDRDPRQTQLEVTVQEQLFCPCQRHVGYIRLSGLVFEHGADGLPVPQRAMVSTWRGHHWIIEDCRLQWANAVGLDIGNEDWRADRHEPCGGHIVRRNHISHCGICGLAGVGSVDATLVAENVIEHVGGRVTERLWESAGCKLHVAKGVLIRGNVFRHTRDASGLWLDYLNENCRVTGNVFADIETILGALYLEVSHAANTIDGNFFWDIRSPGGTAAPPPGTLGAMGVSADTGEGALVAHNFFGRVQHGYAVGFHRNQKDRLVGTRAGLCRRNGAFNNILVQCPRRICFAQPEENQADGNLYDERDRAASFHLAAPTAVIVDLAAWQEYFKWDVNGREAHIEAELDPDTLVLRLRIEGPVPGPAPICPAGRAGLGWQAMGPFPAALWPAILSTGLQIQLPPARPGQAGGK